MPPDVRVNDAGENDVIGSLDKVKQWIKTCGNQFHLRLEIRDVRNENGIVVVTVLSSGDFDGSPQPFHYHFTVENDLNDLSILRQKDGQDRMMMRTSSVKFDASYTINFPIVSTSPLTASTL